MAKEVKFSLVFRDMWQSAGKYQPRVDQLVKVAPAIIKMATEKTPTSRCANGPSLSMRLASRPTCSTAL